MKKQFLVTSNQTSFSVTYLWDCTLQILQSNASFESLSKIYNDLHFDNLPQDVMLCRVEAQRKRLSEAVLTFVFLELGQRYRIPSIIAGGIDETILVNKQNILEKFQEIWTADHKCDTTGCENIITIDGGMKPTRFLCANKLGGVTEFSESGLKVVSDCPHKPPPESKFYRRCKFSDSPAMTSSSVSKETTTELRSHRNYIAVFKDTRQDQVYVVESLL